MMITEKNNDIESEPWSNVCIYSYARIFRFAAVTLTLTR